MPSLRLLSSSNPFHLTRLSSLSFHPTRTFTSQTPRLFDPEKQASDASTSKSSSSTSAKPAISHPTSAAEKDDPEVKKHNDEMRNKASEQTPNQLSEEDQKTNPLEKKGKSDAGEGQVRN